MKEASKLIVVCETKVVIMDKRTAGLENKPSDSSGASAELKSLRMEYS